MDSKAAAERIVKFQVRTAYIQHCGHVPYNTQHATWTATRREWSCAGSVLPKCLPAFRCHAAQAFAASSMLFGGADRSGNGSAGVRLYGLGLVGMRAHGTSHVGARGSNAAPVWMAGRVCPVGAAHHARTVLPSGSDHGKGKPHRRHRSTFLRTHSHAPALLSSLGAFFFCLAQHRLMARPF